MTNAFGQYVYSRVHSSTPVYNDLMASCAQIICVGIKKKKQSNLTLEMKRKMII
jgi:hypothetical protein